MLNVRFGQLTSIAVSPMYLSAVHRRIGSRPLSRPIPRPYPSPALRPSVIWGKNELRASEQEATSKTIRKRKEHDIGETMVNAVASVDWFNKSKFELYGTLTTNRRHSLLTNLRYTFMCRTLKSRRVSCTYVTDGRRSSSKVPLLLAKRSSCSYRSIP
jgi:hypothetical protein